MTMDNKFKLREHTRWDKKIHIIGPMTLDISIDYDDVDHEQVDLEVRRLLDVLNQNWVPVEQLVWIDCVSCAKEFRDFKRNENTRCESCRMKDMGL